MFAMRQNLPVRVFVFFSIGDENVAEMPEMLEADLSAMEDTRYGVIDKENCASIFLRPFVSGCCLPVSGFSIEALRNEGGGIETVALH